MWLIPEYPEFCFDKTVCDAKLNMQSTLAFACIFKFMSLYMHFKKTWIWSAYWYDNMQKYAPHRPQLYWWCQGASQLQVGVGLTRMAATPRRRRPFCTGTLCGWGCGGWFSPSTGRRSGRYVHHVGVAPVPTLSGPQVTNPKYPGLSQFIWWYPLLTPDIKSYPVFRWTVEVRRGVTRPAAAARQLGADETNGISTSACRDIPGQLSLRLLSWLIPGMQVWLFNPNSSGLSRDMQV